MRHVEAARRAIATQIEHTRQKGKDIQRRISTQCQEWTHDPEYTGREKRIFQNASEEQQQIQKSNNNTQEEQTQCWEEQQDHQNHCTIMKRRDFHNDVALSGKARVACPRHAFRVFGGT